MGHSSTPLRLTKLLKRRCLGITTGPRRFVSLYADGSRSQCFCGHIM